MSATTRVRVGDLYKQLTTTRFGIYERVARDGFAHLTALLEHEDPTGPSDRVAGQDAFTRMLDAADISTVSDPYGNYQADEVEVFFDQEANKALFPELCRRLWYNGSVDHALTRRSLQEAERELRQELMRLALAPAEEGKERGPALYLTPDFVPGTVQRPYEQTTDVTMPQIEPAIPLTEMIARTRGVGDTVYRKRTLVSPPATELRLLRVTEAAELPKAKITEAARSVRLYKFGRALEASYEALRRLPIDDFALHVRMLRLQTEVDQVAAALDVAVNGDGNAGTAATVYTKATLDPAMSVNTLSLRGWMAFKLLWANPYQLTTILANQDVVLDALLLNIGTANALLASNPVPGLVNQPWTPINNRFAEGVRFGVTTDAPARQIIGFDNRFAVEHLQEDGSIISEAERYVTRQTEVLTFSMNEGYATFDAGAVKIFNLNA